MNPFSLLLLASTISLGADEKAQPTSPSPADSDPRAEMRERLAKLPPEIREVIASLSPEERRKLRDMSPEQRRAFIADLLKKAGKDPSQIRPPDGKSADAKTDQALPQKPQSASDMDAPEERRKRREEMVEKMKNMSPEERQAFIEEMKARRDRRNGDKVEEGGVIPKRP
ncbi:MAG: hypothetical protein RL095_1228 [Verrucomicrobiota bacterium]|jgi:DNA-binding MarR family transcriptional regulator